MEKYKLGKTPIEMPSGWQDINYNKAIKILTSDMSSVEVLALLAARGKPATLALRVSIKEVFFHCAKAFIRSSLWQPEQWPERHKVSFGEMYAKQRGAAQEMAVAIDEAVADDYQNNL